MKKHDINKYKGEDVDLHNDRDKIKIEHENEKFQVLRDLKVSDYIIEDRKLKSLAFIKQRFNINDFFEYSK